MKNLSHKDYQVPPFNLQVAIKKLVNKEAEMLVKLEQPPIPKYEKKVIKCTEAFKSAFGSLIGNLSI